MTLNATPDYQNFLKGLFHDPFSVSAPTPSSPTLARAIAAEVDPFRDGIVVELGPGTGAVTRALLERGVAPDRLIAIERDPDFVELLRQRFPKVHTFRGDALRFEGFLPQTGAVSAVVSGLPLLHLPLRARCDLLHRALNCRGDGPFVQLSYGWRPLAPADSSIAVTGKIVWRNFPPAHVWTYVRKQRNGY